MLHATIDQGYTPQKKVFKRIVSMLFATAGVYWLFIYGFKFAGMLHPGDMEAFRAGQTFIYFVLLTLWGVEYLREAKRLKAVMDIANEKGCAPNAIEAHELGSSLASFGIIRGLPNAPKTWILPLVNLFGVALSSAMIILQYVHLIQATF